MKRCLSRKYHLTSRFNSSFMSYIDGFYNVLNYFCPKLRMRLVACVKK